MAGTLEIRVDPKDFSRLVRDIRGFDAKLATATRRRLRDAAKPAVTAVQQRLMSRTFSTDVGLASGLAAGTKVSIRAAKGGGGIAITTTGAKLPPGREAMVRAYNKPSFRHPVFGDDRTVWVTQRGRPYFGTVLYPQRPQMQEAMVQALEDAAETIAAGTVSHQ